VGEEADSIRGRAAEERIPTVTRQSPEAADRTISPLLSNLSAAQMEGLTFESLEMTIVRSVVQARRNKREDDECEHIRVER
jgi:hypothetical protein